MLSRRFSAYALAAAAVLATVPACAQPADGELLMWNDRTQSYVGSGLVVEQQGERGAWVPLDPNSPATARRLNFNGASFYVRIERDADGHRAPRPYIGYEGAGALIIERLKSVSNAIIEFRIDGEGQSGEANQSVPPASIFVGMPAPGQFGVGGTGGLNQEKNRWLTIRDGDYSGTQPKGLSYRRVPVETDEDVRSFPPGTFVAVHSTASHARNEIQTIRLGELPDEYTVGGSGAVLSGDWRSRGKIADDVYLFQRVE